MVKISAMPENTPDPLNPALSNRERVKQAEESTKNSFEQYKGSKKTDQWMWIVGIAVVVLAVVAALLAWWRSSTTPEAQPIVDRALVDVNNSAPVEMLNGGFVGTFAGPFNAGESNSWNGVISFAGETAVLVYPTTGCQALLTLMNPDATGSKDTEDIVSYAAQALNRKCDTEGFWEFQSNSGHITGEYFELNDEGEQVSKAAAQLSRNVGDMVSQAASAGTGE